MFNYWVIIFWIEALVLTEVFVKSGSQMTFLLKWRLIQHEWNIYTLPSTIFWDIKQCNPLKVNRRFWGTYRLQLQGRISRARYHLLLRWYFVRLIRPWRWRRYVRPKHWLIFSRLHGVISREIVLFITTAVRTIKSCLHMLPANLYRKFIQFGWFFIRKIFYVLSVKESLFIYVIFLSHSFIWIDVNITPFLKNYVFSSFSG
jgi:hypothetical protein